MRYPDKTDTDIYLRWSDDDFASLFPHGGKINLQRQAGANRRPGGHPCRTFELKASDNKPLRLST